MDPSSAGNFRSLMNSSTSNQEFQGPQSGYNQQYSNFPPPQLDHDFRPPPFGPIQQPYPPPFNPFGAQLGFQQYRGTSSYLGAPYHEGLMQFQQGSFRAAMANDPSSPVLSGSFLGIGGSGSRADESESPISGPQPSHGVPVMNEEQSESSPEEGYQKTGRRLWTKEMNTRLVRAWLNNSNDPVQGVDKKYDHYWKDVAKEYNKHSPKEERRTVAVLKNHWNRYAPIVMKFNHCWNRMKNAHASGESDDQIMQRAHAIFSNENSEKPLLLEYWWREVKGQPKWDRVYHPLPENKRTKLNASGAYTSSSNQDTDEGSEAINHRPIGQKAAKAQKKGKGKVSSHCSEGYLSNDIVNSFNEFQLLKLQAIEKMAEATSEHAKAIAKQAAANKEKTRDKKLSTYLKLVTVDTANFSVEQKAGHDIILKRLTKELFPADES